jgi:hypothetical protein
VVEQLPLSGRWAGCCCFCFKRRQLCEADEHAIKTVSSQHAPACSHSCLLYLALGCCIISLLCQPPEGACLGCCGFAGLLNPDWDQLAAATLQHHYHCLQPDIIAPVWSSTPVAVSSTTCCWCHIPNSVHCHYLGAGDTSLTKAVSGCCGCV